MNLLNTLLNLIYPPHCLVCKARLDADDRHLCKKCLNKIHLINGPTCKHCSRPVFYHRPLCNECEGRKSYLSRVWSWALYDDYFKEIIKLFKYKNKSYVIKAFSRSILQFIEENQILKKIDFIVPVPLHPDKLRMRGYNQSRVLAELIAKHVKIGVLDCLIKTIETRPQNELNKTERKLNIKGVFRVKHPKKICGKMILLVDDIFTTGSTINECAKTLIKAGAKKAYGFTLSRGL